MSNYSTFLYSAVLPLNGMFFNWGLALGLQYIGFSHVLAETELHGSYLFQYSSQVFEIFTVSFLHIIRLMVIGYVFKSSILTFTYSTRIVF